MPLGRIYLIRHAHSLSSSGEDFKKWRERQLSGLGKKQSSDLSEALLREKIDVMVNSSFLRSIQTAEIVSKQLKIPMRINPKFDERVVSQNRDKAYLKDAWKRSILDWDYTPDETGESLNATAGRFIEGLKGEIKSEQNDRIAIITHERALRYTLFKLFGDFVPDVEKREIDNCSWFIIQVMGSEMWLVGIGVWASEIYG